jgi:hypothetical protein
MQFAVGNAGWFGVFGKNNSGSLQFARHLHASSAAMLI